MSRPIPATEPRGKKGHCRIRQSKRPNRQPISPVMQKVRGLLPTVKAAAQLHILSDQPLSTCEKMLSGQRVENVEMLTALLRSDMGRDVLFALMGDASPAWFTRYRKQLDVNEVRRRQAEMQRLIDQLQQEASE